MQTKEVIIIASGFNKAHALQKVVEEGVSHKWPVSFIQLHPNAMIVCDEEASVELKAGTNKYFIDIEKTRMENS
jgi:glucosamine-6-phosphate deaminase